MILRMIMSDHLMAVTRGDSFFYRLERQRLLYCLIFFLQLCPDHLILILEMSPIFWGVSLVWAVSYRHVKAIKKLNIASTAL